MITRKILPYLAIFLVVITAACSPSGSDDLTGTQTNSDQPDEVLSEVTDTLLPPETTPKVTQTASIQAAIASPTTTPSPSPSGEASPTVTPSPSPADITPTLCPMATPEWLRVRPVTSPTSELTQTIYVSINNGEWVMVTTPAGEFKGLPEIGDLEDPVFYYNFVVEVELLPNTEQELTVKTQIREIENNGCLYGGYPLTTNVDINFEPLVIIQESP